MTAIITFYKFVPIQNPRALQLHLKRLCAALEIKGTLLISQEGINASIGGSEEALEKFKKVMSEEPRFSDIWYKPSQSFHPPFKRLTVKLRKEIVTMGIEGIDPARGGGRLAPADFHKRLGSDGVVVVDVRNQYEIKLGGFKGAIDPGTASFNEFPAWVEENKERLAGKTVLTYCTGGIRCEKATAYMRAAGYQNVFQLDGGILNYFEELPMQAREAWDGECFVFDDRMAVTVDSKPTDRTICPTCISIVSEAEQMSPLFVKGKQCPGCAPQLAEFHAARVSKGRASQQEALQRKIKVGGSVRELRGLFRSPEDPVEANRP